MEELKLLIEMVANLPAMALWVLVGFWAYKVIVIGSIYGLIRFVVEKLHSWATRTKQQEVELVLDGVCINGATKSSLLAQLSRIGSRRTGLNYLHESDIQWFRSAIDMKIESEKVEK